VAVAAVSSKFNAEATKESSGLAGNTGARSANYSDISNPALLDP
jgi:hypothetical protein